MKWYKKLLCILGVILLIPFVPLIVLFLIVLFLSLVFLNIVRDFKERSTYKKSRYYQDLKVPYRKTTRRKVFYRAYTSFKEKGTDIRYIRQKSNRFEFFIHQGTLYFLPDFDEVRYSQEKEEWTVVYRKYSEESCLSLQKYFDSCLDLLEKEYKDMPTRLIVERSLVNEDDLTDKTIPHALYIVHDFETAFDEVPESFLPKYPQNAKELYELLLNTPDLCGNFELIGEEIHWEYKDLALTIARLYIDVVGLTHWHPSDSEIYDDVCAITKSGSVLVIQKSPSASCVLYKGKKEKCPYAPNKKGFFSKIYYFLME